MNDTFKLLTAVIIFGTNGFFIRYINAPNETLIMARGLIGALFIVFLMFLNKDYPEFKSIKKNLKYLLASGTLMGLSYIFLFKGYDYSISITTLINNSAPIIALVISAIFLKEKINKKQNICILLVVIGVLLVSGIFETKNETNIASVVFGLISAIGYVFVLLINKKMKDIKPLDRSVIQLFMSFLVILPFAIYKNAIPSSLDQISIIFLISMGMINTGLAYSLYFSAISVLPTSKIAIIGYLEPVIAIVIGTVIFNEQLTILELLGCVLVILAACVSELSANK